jgi:hypothetical protein
MNSISDREILAVIRECAPFGASLTEPMREIAAAYEII